MDTLFLNIFHFTFVFHFQESADSVKYQTITNSTMTLPATCVCRSTGGRAAAYGARCPSNVTWRHCWWLTNLCLLTMGGEKKRCNVTSSQSWQL